MFPNGIPGAALLLLRLVCAVFMGMRAILSSPATSHTETVLLQSLALGSVVLLLIGLWTPIAGFIVVLVELWAGLSRTNGLADSVLLASVGAALAALGPGAHSIDAKLFGRKRIQIEND
jgi:putative oxidoreductase